MAADIHDVPDEQFDRELVANVFPQDWVNPAPAPVYNLAVIGAGTAGLVAAAGAAGLGAKVALIERQHMGGDCLNVGCVPSKALLRAARAYADVRDAAAYGVEVPPGVRVNFAAVMARMRRLRGHLSPIDSAARFRSLGVDVFLGQGRFSGPTTMTVDGKTLRFRKAVIATGARATVPPIPGLAAAGYLTNETVFALTERPRRIAVIGAGPLGCEVAQAFERFGAQVSLLEMAPQLLGREDPDAAQRVGAALRRDGVEIHLGCTILNVARGGTDKVLHLAVNGRNSTLPVDEIFVGVGRTPNVDELGLDVAGVAFDAMQGIQVNDWLQTTNRRIYAAGDVCSPYKFTHVADAQARIVIRNALFGGRAKASALTIPWCTYTDPEVAHVGLSAREAEARGIPVQTFVQELADVDRAVLDGETEGCVKVHVRQGSDRLVGATIVARHAGEMLSELTLAMSRGVGLASLTQVIHPYPTQALALQRLGDAYNRTRLTPTVKNLFARWLAWAR